MSDEGRYTVAYAPKAARELSRIDKVPATRIADAVDKLGVNPFPPGHRKLVGYDDLWRIRVGNYRVVYTVDHGELTVLALRVAHRSTVYRDL
jgi:mRNA interferase RelE/StbE